MSAWWQQLWRRFVRPRPQPTLTCTVVVDDWPEQFLRGTCYLHGETPHAWASAFLCPCGCGQIVYLNLQPGIRPRWFVRIEASGRPTVRPSVWRTNGCRSHFVVDDGFIEWW